MLSFQVYASYTMINNFIMSVISRHLAFKRTYKYHGMSMYNDIMRCMPMLHNALQVDHSVHRWHLALVCQKVSFSSMYSISTCEIFHLVCSIIISPCILKCKIIISSTPMCYTKCHTLIISFMFRKELTSIKNVLLIISGRDTFETSRHLG